MNSTPFHVQTHDPAIRAIQDFVANAPLPLLIADRTRVRLANPALLELLGYSLDELLDTLGPLDLIGPSERDYIREHAFRSGAVPSEHLIPIECRRKNGSVFRAHLSFWSTSFNGEVLCALAIQPASGREASGDLMDVLACTESLAISGACEYDLATGLLTRSPGLFKILNEPFDGDPVWLDWLIAHVPEDEADLVRSLIEGERLGLHCELEHSVIRHDGSLRTVLLRSVCEVGADGRACRTISVMQDITAQRAVEQERHRMFH